MNMGQIIERFRDDTQDKDVPYFWTDQEIINYANEAVAEACRRALLLVDSTSSVADVAISAGDTFVELDESIIYVRRARLCSQSVTLTPIVARTMDERYPGWENSEASTPIVFIPDWESGKLRLYPPSAQDDSAKMTVVRTPLESEEMSEDEDSPIIPRRYHLGLIYWMEHLAYLKPDADTFDPKKAESSAERFAVEFGPPSAAIDEHWAAEQYYDIGDC